MGTSLLVVGLVLLVAAWRTHHQLARSITRSRVSAPLTRYPSVTVIRPIRGLDAGAEENVRAALESSYPNEVETLFVFDDATEPAVPIVERVIHEHPRANARIVYCGPPPLGRTGKLNAMIVGLELASGELIAFADSDVRHDRDMLRVLVETLLNTKDAGSAFAPVVVTEPPRTPGDAGYALLLNGFYGPAAAYVAQKEAGTLPFIMGQFMIFKREALDAIGGLENATGQLVDDMYLGRRLNDVGYENAVAPHPLPIIQFGLPWGEFLKIYVRWLTFSRSGLPGRSFTFISWLRGVEFYLALAAAAVACLSGWWWVAALNGASAVSVGVSLTLLHRRLGGASLALSKAWVPFAVMLAAPLVALCIQFRRELDWRGRRYVLNPEARLAR